MVEELQNLINKRRKDIVEWVDNQRKQVELPIYSSFDIRDNGKKATIVDSNLFPAGFNNLTRESQNLASKYFKEFIPKICKSKDILIIPEAHTRNLFYLSNLNTLKSILINASYKVVLGSIRKDIDDTLEVKDSNNKSLVLEKMKNVNCKLQTKSFKHGMILLNNDFSTPAPTLLNKVKECIAPPIKLGWMHRKKSNHFKHFCKLTAKFSNEFGIDEYRLCPMTQEVDDVDFSTGKNLDKISKEANNIIATLKDKYEEYGIKEEPYVFIKDNSGTYGMGILTVQSGKEIMNLNSKQRRKMKAGKEKLPISSVIVQEGVTTRFKVNNKAAEPVLYSVSGKNIGGFMRIHDEKDAKSSLNAPGAKFDVLLRDNITKPIVDFIDEKKELSLYSVLANIANIAIGKEMEEVK